MIATEAAAEGINLQFCSLVINFDLPWNPQRIEQIKALNRQSRLAPTIDEQHQIQKKITELEKKKRRQRQKIFDIEDEIMDKRDSLVDGLEKRMKQKTSVKNLFTIRWQVV